MNKLFIGLAILAVILLPFGIYVYLNLPYLPKTNKNTSPTSAPTQTQSYTNTTHNYSLSYPIKWVHITANSTQLYTDELFFASQSAQILDTQKGIGVRVMESLGDTDTQSYFEALLKQPMGQTTYDSGRITKLANVKVQNMAAVMQIEEAVTPDGLPYYSKNVYVLKDGKLYVLMNSGSTKKEADAQESVFNDLVSSFTFR